MNATVCDIPVMRYAMGRRGMKLAAPKPEPAIRAEYAPDNSRIGQESKGIQSVCFHSKVYWLLVTGCLDNAAVQMVTDAKLAYGKVIDCDGTRETWVQTIEFAPVARVTVDVEPVESVTVTRPVQTVSYFQWMQERPASKNVNVVSAEKENQTWKRQRIPMRGQRPTFNR